MAQEVLISISLIIGVAAILAILAKLVKQPPIIAYIISGILVGPIFLGFLGPEAASSELMQIFAHIGVALLLFIVGLSLDLRVFKEVGGVATIGGLGGVILTAGIGFLIAIGLGFGSLTALYLAFALAFSSTVVVIKLLSDKKEIDTLHGRIALGILIMQDFIAALALMIFPVIQTGELNIILLQVGKIIALIIGVFILAKIVSLFVLQYIARNQEVLFLSGLAWALVISTLFNALGLSLEIGALIAGMSLASSKYNLELGGKIKPLRDFFIIIFFIFFGSQLVPPITYELITQAIIFSVFVLIGKPIILMFFMRFFGYKKRTNFLAGSSLAQISEFSLILVLLGFTLGHINQETMSLVVLISLITIAISSYGIHNSQRLFHFLSKILRIFEGNTSHKTIEELPKTKIYDVVLFGHNRTGYSLVKTFKKMGLSFIVVDYNPRVTLKLAKKGINCVYGDAGDKDFIENLNLDKAKLIISTIPEPESNILIKKRLKELKSKTIFIATSEHISEALDLYEEGVDYVVLPHILGGEYTASMISSNKLEKEKYRKIAKEHIRELEKRTN